MVCKKFKIREGKRQFISLKSVPMMFNFQFFPLSRVDHIDLIQSAAIPLNSCFLLVSVACVSTPLIPSNVVNWMKAKITWLAKKVEHPR